MKKLTPTYWQQRLAAFVFATVVVSSNAMAAEDLNAVGDRVSTVFKTFGEVLQYGAILAGMGSAAWGIWQLTIGRKDRQQSQQGATVPILAVLGGAALASLVFVLGSVSATIFGSDQTSINTVSGF